MFHYLAEDEGDYAAALYPAHGFEIPLCGLNSFPMLRKRLDKKSDDESPRARLDALRAAARAAPALALCGPHLDRARYVGAPPAGPAPAPAETPLDVLLLPASAGARPQVLRLPRRAD